ncbi:DNA helicase-2 / ATP-dependent DNA helicase PcrA [Alicyclobacillus macrosporangiidus]|uniref:DNA helicase-2 / ATP-dependent DNA helicase PcrA n=2 Tax=Alicyclobacillus macrosporangiidus TaxID=392015 RepID=A0A1I7F7C1_9BACL|nr:DNA helicase-2 / ATP-dependent DNA helicase PcrA [Alicyclobacillus macrosporangiidus]
MPPHASNIRLGDPMHEENEHLRQVLSRIAEMSERLHERIQAREAVDESDRDEAQTAEQVAESVVSGLREEQLKVLAAAAREPYFGRIDFREEGVQDPVPLYIGKRGLEDSASGERMVIDWRAPVASLFYSFSGQDRASYESPDGEITGEVYLKRNIAVRDGRLQRVVDSYVKGQENLNVADEFLLYRLAENKDNRLRDIVSTIQAEQDRIIRAERDRAIVIQGVAGSGKTTVALHRIAYLLYRHADRLRPERMVIFAPNAMFVDYISEVLPELGVGNIQQTTFTKWALDLLDHAVAVRDPGDRLARWFAPRTSPAARREFDLARTKGSVRFQEAIDERLRALEGRLVPEGDFEPWEGARLDEATIRGWYEQDYAHYPPGQRRDRVLARVKRWMDMMYKRVKEQDRTGAVRKRAQSRLRAYQSRWPQWTPLDIYEQVLAEVLPDAPAWEAQTVSGRRGRRKRPLVEPEDLAPLVYIHARWNGMEPHQRFDHVVIDEAQDFSPFQIRVLQLFCPGQSFTILGDLSQSIHTYQGITDWSAFLELFDEGKRAFFQLDVSYRSTMEIIDFANEIIRPFDQFVLAKPVFRSGDPVVVERVAEREQEERAVQAVQALSRHAATVAVMARTEELCERVHRALVAAGIQAHRIHAKDEQYEGGVSVLPVYLAKGLEFDAVLLVGADARHYDDSPLSAKLLYVGCTRALHRLWVQYAGEASPLLRHRASAEREAGGIA